MTRRILVIGGTGSFGERLVEGLLHRTDAEVVIGARGVTRAEALARRLRIAFPDRVIESAAIDTATVNAEHLKALNVWCVIDAAGPFQDSEPTVARAAIAAGCHYVDLADARDFVARFPALDAEARAAGVVALTGASSTPALSHAALDHLTAGWRRIDTIEIAISPGNRAPRGLSVMQAILARTGKPVKIFHDGHWTEAPGWGLLTRRHLPGLGQRWLSLTETPDLDLVVERFAPRESALFRAGLELPVMHLGLWVASLPVRWGWLRSLAPFAKAFLWMAERLLAFGTDRGGMVVEARGRDADDRPVQATWSLVAEAGDGPNIPTLPALAVVRALLAGETIASGARACVGVLPLAAIAAEFARFRIAASTIFGPALLYPQVLGESFESAPRAIRAGHAVERKLILSGRASIEPTANRLGWLMARIFGFPHAAEDVPVQVVMTRSAAGEIWERVFGDNRFRSELSPGPKRGEIHECFGPIRVLLDLTADAEGITMRSRVAYLGPIRLPQWMTPRSEALERLDAEGRFSFDVPISLPFAGQLVRYRGWLVPQTQHLSVNLPEEGQMTER